MADESIVIHPVAVGNGSFALQGSQSQIIQFLLRIRSLHWYSRHRLSQSAVRMTFVNSSRNNEPGVECAWMGSRCD